MSRVLHAGSPYPEIREMQAEAQQIIKGLNLARSNSIARRVKARKFLVRNYQNGKCMLIYQSLYKNLYFMNCIYLFSKN